jgi:hypothetical protein
MYYFLCKCVLYYCHRVSTQLQLTNIYIYILLFAKSDQKYREGARPALTCTIFESRKKYIHFCIKWHFGIQLHLDNK